VLTCFSDSEFREASLAIFQSHSKCQSELLPRWNVGRNQRSSLEDARDEWIWRQLMSCLTTGCVTCCKRWMSSNVHTHLPRWLVPRSGYSWATCYL